MDLIRQRFRRLASRCPDCGGHIYSKPVPAQTVEGVVIFARSKVVHICKECDGPQPAARPGERPQDVLQ